MDVTEWVPQDAHAAQPAAPPDEGGRGDSSASRVNAPALNPTAQQPGARSSPSLSTPDDDPRSEERSPQPSQDSVRTTSSHRVHSPASSEQRPYGDTRSPGPARARGDGAVSPNPSTRRSATTSSSTPTSSTPRSTQGDVTSNEHTSTNRRRAPGDRVPEATAPTQQRASVIANSDSESEQSVCIICLSSSAQKLRLACGHSFCPPCITQWLEASPTCPTCRRQLGHQEHPSMAPVRAAIVGSTPREMTLMPPIGPAIGTPNTLYVWCTCWRRLVIPDGATTTCVCGKAIAPDQVRAKNMQAWDGEYPVNCRESCANCYGNECPCTCNMTTRAAWCGLCSAVSLIFLCGLPAVSFGVWKAVNLCCTCLSGNVCSFINQVTFLSSFVAPLPLPFGLLWVSKSECCCFADRTGRLHPEAPNSWNKESFVFCCCHPAQKTCVADDNLALCLLCEREEQQVNKIWLV